MDASGPPRPGADLFRRAGRRGSEGAIATLLLLAATVTVLVTVAVVAILAFETLAFFADPAVTLREFFTERRWTPLFAPELRHFGIAPLLTGTLLVTGIALLVGLPLGLAAAIWLAEFADGPARRRLLGLLELLAGIPTVVLGFFALTFVTPYLRELIPGLNLFNPLSAGIVMGFMIMPIVTSLSADAMLAVPHALREAAYGLGASQREVITKVVVPAALSGIMASFILAMSRAVGETMIVTLAAGQQPNLTLDPRETIATMTAFIVQAATGDQAAGSLAARSLYAVAATLFVLTFLLNLASRLIVRRFAERYE